MKLKFKKQQYQEDASLSIVKCFEGQPKGSRQDLIGRREKKIDLTNCPLLWSPVRLSVHLPAQAPAG